MSWKTCINLILIIELKSALEIKKNEIYPDEN